MKVLQEISTWKAEGAASDMDVVTRLRLKTVPEGYKYHLWTKGSTLLIITIVHELGEVLVHIHYALYLLGKTEDLTN